MGPGYAGSRISREALLDDNNGSAGSEDEEDEDEDEEFADPDDADINADDVGDDEDIDSDAAFGESDDEKFSKFTFRGSSHHATNGVTKRPTASDFMSDSDNQEAGAESEGPAEDETDEDILDVDEQHSVEEDDSKASEEEEEDDASGSEEESDNDDKHESSEKAKRDELRKIMNEEQTTVIAAISQAAKDDANKGNAVKEQRKVFDSLLNVRIALQKALIATNSLSTVEENPTSTAEEEDSDAKPYQAAEDAALKLWNTLDGIRHELTQTNINGASKKRKRDVVDSSTPSAAMWERMQDAEVASLDNRRRVLEKWWGKVKGSAPPSTGKLLTTGPAQNITAALQDQLAKPGLVESTRRPRSCAPVQEKQKLVEDASIYDDTGFYKLLLNQLVEQRKAEAGSGGGAAVVTRAQWAVKEAKMRKVVDTKASKGRKLRYTVHEKLQNFMAPEDRTQWAPDAIDRFFGTLLGQKMTLGEDAMDGDGAAAEEDDITPEEAGLRLFRS